MVSEYFIPIILFIIVIVLIWKWSATRIHSESVGSFQAWVEYESQRLVALGKSYYVPVVSPPPPPAFFPSTTHCVL